jgi:hypothetical protein
VHGRDPVSGAARVPSRLVFAAMQRRIAPASSVPPNAREARAGMRWAARDRPDTRARPSPAPEVSMPAYPVRARRAKLAAAVAAALFCVRPAAATETRWWAPWSWPVLDPRAWDATCGGARVLQVHASGPVHNFGDEGRQSRLAVGACVAAYGSLSLQLDGVVSPIEAFDHIVGGGRAVGLGVDAILRWWPGGQRAWFAEAGGGLQYAVGSSFPADGTHFQFTVIGGVGRSFGLGAGRTLDVGLRWFHISNANLLPSNSGYDSIQLTVGITLPASR